MSRKLLPDGAGSTHFRQAVKEEVMLKLIILKIKGYYPNQFFGDMPLLPLASAVCALAGGMLLLLVFAGLLWAVYPAVLYPNAVTVTIQRPLAATLFSGFWPGLFLTVFWILAHGELSRYQKACSMLRSTPKEFALLSLNQMKQNAAAKLQYLASQLALAETAYGPMSHQACSARKLFEETFDFFKGVKLIPWQNTYDQYFAKKA